MVPRLGLLTLVQVAAALEGTAAWARTGSANTAAVRLWQNNGLGHTSEFLEIRELVATITSQ
jgi:hypothetical protein